MSESRPDRADDRRLRPTMVADLVVPVDGQLSLWGAAMASAAVTTVSGALLLALGLSQAGIFAVFLTASALASPLTDLLDANREAIWKRGEDPWRANSRTVLGLLGIFVGMAIAFACLAAWLGEDDLRRGFGFATEGIGEGEHLLLRSFGPWTHLLQRNLVVLVVLVVLTLAFRTHGALLVLGWNAAAWAAVLVLLTARAVAVSSAHPAVFVAVAAAALLPHILLEASAYVVASLAAIFLSQGIARYPPTDPRFRRVGRAGATLLLTAVGLLVVGALVEELWATSVLAWLDGK